VTHVPYKGENPGVADLPGGQQGIDQSAADTPEKHAAFLKSEFARWGKVIRDADVKVE